MDAGDSPYLPSLEALQRFPPTLVKHTSQKLHEILTVLIAKIDTDESIRGSLAEVESVLLKNMLDDLITSFNITQNGTFADLTKQLARALNVLPASSYTHFLETSGRCTKTMLEQYETYLSTNKRIFETITNHHQEVKAQNWDVIANNTQALVDYSVSAWAMGAKPWVLEANQWMATYIRSFFFGDASTKFLRKTLPAPTKDAGLPSSASLPFKISVEDRDELIRIYLERMRHSFIVSASSGEKVRVLDVGSCYNPLARFTEAEVMEITAIDLHPVAAPDASADTVVHTCDFLTVSVTDDHAIHWQLDAPPSPSVPSSSSSSIATVSSRVVLGLPRLHYHAVTMSLVLSYLSDPAARAIMVRKAHALLQPHHGLLLIVEKDSILRNPVSHSTGGAAVDQQDMRATLQGWKRAMRRLGFTYVKYEYRAHHPSSSTNPSVAAATTNAASEKLQSTSSGSRAKMAHIMVFATCSANLHAKTSGSLRTDSKIDEIAPEEKPSEEEISEGKDDGDSFMDQLWIKQDLDREKADRIHQEDDVDN